MGAAITTEEPKYAIIEKEPPFEIRSYAPMIVAEVQVEGDLDARYLNVSTVLNPVRLQSRY